MELCCKDTTLLAVAASPVPSGRLPRVKFAFLCESGDVMFHQPTMVTLLHVSRNGA
ncbi:hypothetical protein CCACVL1_27482 [Corchorus capsularis]|uniref:Uncharacterized protein n=1 Tax=Corchorus capsularis TaxID=210143 RepID=A0A1R3G9X1_COCAP|nr:hypothetical protein CCACVL1_27482 [Corchorus capsularis]